jgi:hypothetical protein
MLQYAWLGCRTIFSGATGSACTYTAQSPLGIFALVLLVGALPEIPLHHILLPGKEWRLALLLDGALLYSTLWVFGFFGAMAAHPHRIEQDAVVFRRGPIAEAYVARTSIAGAHVASGDSKSIRRKNPRAYFGLPGSGLVHVRMHEPVRVRAHYPLRREWETAELVVASDRPHELCRLLQPA